MKLVLTISVMMILLVGCKAEETSTETGYQISDVPGHQEQHLGEGRLASQARHRLRMLFPLLLRISSRLAQIVPMALAAMMATFAMALFAKKAFIISLAALGLMLYDKYKKKEHHAVHYFAQPPHKKHISDRYYNTNEPQEYTAHSEDEYSFEWDKYDSGRSAYEDAISNIVQNISAAAAKWYQRNSTDT